MKKLLVFSAYYEPEKASSLYLSTNLYEYIAQNGWQVELFCPIPTRGATKEERQYYKKHKIEKKINNNLIIHRISLMKEGKGNIGRAIRYLIMNIVFIIKGLTIKADAIFVQSTPPTQGAMASIIKKIKHIPLIYNLQDIFPDSLVSTGMTHKGSLLWKIGRKVENFTYKNSNKIIVISNDMKNNIKKKGVDEKKISLIYNWVDTNRVKPIDKKENKLFDELNLDRENFYVAYAGNLGHSQGIDTIIKAAEILESKLKIKFVIFGGGTEFNYYNQIVKNKKNISLFPLQPSEKISEVYSLGNCSIVSCKKGVGKGAMPSKTGSIMACARPVLLSFDKDTELQNIILETKSGLFSEAENYFELADNIIKLYENSQISDEYGINARETAEKLFSKNICLSKYLNEINNV